MYYPNDRKPIQNYKNDKHLNFRWMLACKNLKNFTPN